MLLYRADIHQTYFGISLDIKMFPWMLKYKYNILYFFLAIIYN